MMNDRRSWILDNVVSPYGLAAISYTVFWFSCLIPPSLYSYYINEPDLMFLDPPTILFYTSCVAAFAAGVLLTRWLTPRTTFERKRVEARISPTWFLLLPLTIGLAATIISDVRLVRSTPTLLLLLFAQQGQDLKDAIAFGEEGNVTFPFVMLTAIVWWAYWRFHDLDLKGWRKVLVLAIWWVALLLIVVSTVLTLSRSSLLVAVCGLAILYILRKTLMRQVTLRFLVRGGTSIAAFTSLLFFAFSFLRGSSSWEDQIYLLIGYTFASYNRLAAVVNGTIRAPLIDRGIHLSGFVSYNHTFNRFIPINQIMGWRGNADLFDSAFWAVSNAGLDGHLVWPGAFGDIFLSLGWYSFIFVFGYGLLYGLVWKWMLQGRAIGVVLYPSFGFCILFWLGSNQLLSSDSAVYWVGAVLLAGYELIFVKRVEQNRNGKGLRTADS